ncbi:hypothetical protein VTK56DRAFT_491 [Thermocarpiscus australiensis]
MSFASFALCTVAAAVLPAAVLGQGIDFPEDNRMVQQDGLIRYPITPRQGAPLFGKHSKRQLETPTASQLSGTLYTIDLTLGTPGQTVPVQFDTGSSELWVNPVCSKSSTPDFCNAQPRFTNSTTLADLDQQGSVTYGTGFADFEYVSDYVSIGSAKVSQQIFGVAYDSSASVVGILGTGPSLTGWESEYPFVIDSLAKQGLTNSRAFSLDLRGFDSNRGSVIFGGIDLRRIRGPLIKRPIIPAEQSPDGNTRFWIYLNGISVNQPGGNVVEVYSTPEPSEGQPVLLDSGYTLSALPSAIFRKLLAAFPSAKYVPSADLYTVDCADPGQGGSLDFKFGSQVINVPYYDFIWHYPDTDLCVLGAIEDNEFPVLGDTFLRSAYVIYDWDNRMIHLGQSDDCGSKLVPIGEGPDAVPYASGECGQPTTSTTSSSSSAPATASTTSEASSVPVTSTSSDSASSTTVSETSAVSATSTASKSSTASPSSPTASDSSSVPESTIFTSTPPYPTSSSTRYANTTASHPTITKSTLTYTSTKTYTITSCPPTVTNCPVGHVTTAIVTATTAVCPETTGTYTITKTWTCPGSNHGCGTPGGGGGATKTRTLTVTVSPAPTKPTPVVVPGCTPGATGPAGCAHCAPAGPTTLLPAPPTSVPGCAGCVNATATATATATAKPSATQKVPVTAGAGRAGLASGVGAVVVVVGVLAVMGL